MKRKTILIIVLAVCSLLLPAQPALQQPQRLSLLFIGDIMGHDEQLWSPENRETREYNYDDVFSYIKPVISGADLAIGNLEVTLAGPPYKGYPAFSSPSALAAACRDAGIDCLVTANNHSADRGKKGITGTISRLDSLGIPHTGTFISREARDSLTPLILEKNGFRIALLNYTYGTNGIKVPEPLVVNMLNKDSIASDIARAKVKNPDLVVLFLHWGVEYDTVPRREQTEMAEFFFSRGADLVIGSHPHVIQKMEWLRADDQSKDRLVAYSLGNFVSNQRRQRTDGGTMIRIDVERRAERTVISSAGYVLTWVHTPIEKYRKKFYILPAALYENKADFFSNPADYSKMKSFISDSRKLLNRQNINIPEYKLPESQLNFNY